MNSGAVGAAAVAAVELNSGAVGAPAAVHTFHSLAAAVVIAAHLCAAAAAAAAAASVLCECEAQNQAHRHRSLSAARAANRDETCDCCW